jgi:hypothetical protein
MSGANSEGTNDPTASGTEPPWPDPSKSSWGYHPPTYQDPYQDPYQAPYQPPYQHPTPGPGSVERSGFSVWWLVGAAALFAVAGCGFGLLIARLLWG